MVAKSPVTLKFFLNIEWLAGGFSGSIAFILIGCTVSSLPSGSKINTNHLTVVSATQKAWNPGTVRPDAERNSAGLQYQIELTSSSAKPILFDSLLVDGRKVGVEVIKNSQRMYKEPIKKGETVLLNAFSSTEPTRQEVIDLLNGNKVAALVEYRIDGQSYWLPITTIKKSEAVKRVQ